jgi:hypothetical protein
MAQPVLDCSGVMAGVGQCVSASMAEHVAVDLEIEPSALRKPFDMAINGVRGEWSAALGREYESRVGKLPAKLA